MKIKTLLVGCATLLSSFVISQGATFIISNANDGMTDTLYADSNNVLMNGGIVAIGYFTASTTVGDIDTIPELFSKLGQFTVVTSIAPGSNSGTLGGAFAGYADQFPTLTDIGAVNVGNPLLNRVIYTIVSSASSLGSAVSTSEFALFQSGVLTGDTPNVVSVVGSPAGVTPIIGTLGSVTGNFGGQGESTFTTLKMAAIPEPSAALLGALGALGLLRRRRA